jgi:epoxyqueuosine reductase QueG
MSELRDTVQFADELKEFALSLGVELYGVASAQMYAEQFPDKPAPSRFIEDARSVIVIGMPFEPGTVATVLRPELAGLRGRATEQVGTSGVQPVGAERFFLGEENGVIARELQYIGYKMAKRLRHAGFKSFYVPGKQNARFRTAPFYYMPAMYLAGLGTLGLNCCILTPEFGPRVYVGAVLTDATLPAGSPMEEGLCTRCGLCVENCPIGAIDGEGWKNPWACASYGCCGTCMAICPVGEI